MASLWRRNMSMWRLPSRPGAAFGEMIAYLKAHPSVRVMLVEKADRLYRNLKDWVTVDELDVESTSRRKAWTGKGRPGGTRAAQHKLS